MVFSNHIVNGTQQDRLSDTGRTKVIEDSVPHETSPEIKSSRPEQVKRNSNKYYLYELAWNKSAKASYRNCDMQGTCLMVSPGFLKAFIARLTGLIIRALRQIDMTKRG